jgi:hypothetical protein
VHLELLYFKESLAKIFHHLAAHNTMNITLADKLKMIPLSLGRGAYCRQVDAYEINRYCLIGANTYVAPRSRHEASPVEHAAYVPLKFPPLLVHLGRSINWLEGNPRPSMSDHCWSVFAPTTNDWLPLYHLSNNTPPWLDP